MLKRCYIDIKPIGRLYMDQDLRRGDVRIALSSVVIRQKYVS